MDHLAMDHLASNMEVELQGVRDGLLAERCTRRGRMSGSGIGEDVLQILAVALRYTWATYWQVDVRSQTLRSVAVWSHTKPELESLRSHTLSRALSLSEGTAGHSWRGRRVVWTTDLVKDMCLPRSLDAKAAGLQGGIWIPVQTVREVVAVIELLGSRVPPATEGLVSAADSIGRALATGLESGR